MATETETAAKEIMAPLGYQLLNKLGEGSFAAVYIVKYSAEGKTVQMACKIMKTDKAMKDPKALGCLTREVNVMINISHPHIIHTFSIVQKNAVCMIFMRNAEYGNVTHFLIKHGALKEKVARFWIRQVASALMYLHELDLVHRDVKCDNLLITYNHNVKLSDFGFTRFSLDQNGKPCKCTTYCGSIPYTAPEILKGVPYEGKPTDVWSLGCVLFVMLNKKLPFKSNNNFTKLYKEQNDRQLQWVPRTLDVTSNEGIEIVISLLEPNCKKRMTCEAFLGCKWLKSDLKSVKQQEAEKQALEDAYSRKHNIKPYKFVKITSDTNNLLNILVQNNKSWPSVKVLNHVGVSLNADGGEENHGGGEQPPTPSEAFKMKTAGGSS